MKKSEPYCKKIIFYINKFVGLFVRVFIGMLPRDNAIIVYGGALDLFIDNAKHFFIIAHEELPEYRHIWLTKRTEILILLRRYGYETYYSYSFKGLWAILRAGTVVYDNRIKDFSYYNLSQGSLNIDIWHGVALKLCGRHLHNYYKPKNKFWETYKEHVHGEYFVCPSLRHLPLSSGSFDVCKENLIVSDYPRNLILYKTEEERVEFIKKYESRDYLDLYNSINNQKRKRIIYMPTFRDSNPLYINAAFPDWNEFNTFCKNCNIEVYLKLHRVTPMPCDFSYSHIHIIDNSIDIYPILPLFDMLITDYSSIMYDFALMNKPVVLYVFDLEDYMANSRMLYIPELKLIFKELKVVKNLDELKVVLSQNLDLLPKMSKTFACPGDIQPLINVIKSKRRA